MGSKVKKVQKQKSPKTINYKTNKLKNISIKTAVKKPNKNKVKTKLPVKLAAYLEKAGVRHKVLEHKTVYTAYDAAQTLKKKLDEVAKSLLILADKNYYLIILSADQNLDFKKLQSFLSKNQGAPVKIVKIPGEKVMEAVFKVRAGAMGAFGRVHKLPVVIEKKLAETKKAIFSSGSFNHSIEMGVKDFMKLENALLGAFGVKKKIKLQSTGKAKKVKKKVNKPKAKIKKK
jgi:Ala-tRNA(Pro) deacylase